MLNPVFTAAHGRLGKVVLVYRHGRQHLRPYVKGANPDTPAQRLRRGTFRQAVSAWQALDISDKRQWNRRSTKPRCSGSHLFISHFMKNAPTAYPAPDPVLPEKSAGPQSSPLLRSSLSDPSLHPQSRPAVSISHRRPFSTTDNPANSS